MYIYVCTHTYISTCPNTCISMHAYNHKYLPQVLHPHISFKELKGTLLTMAREVQNDRLVLYKSLQYIDCVAVCIVVCVAVCVAVQTAHKSLTSPCSIYGVAMISRLLKFIRLFCRISSLFYREWQACALQVPAVYRLCCSVYCSVCCSGCCSADSTQVTLWVCPPLQYIWGGYDYLAP